MKNDEIMGKLVHLYVGVKWNEGKLIKQACEHLLTLINSHAHET